MTLVRGEEKISVDNTYIITPLHRLFTTLIHALLVFPGTVRRNFENGRGKQIDFSLKLAVSFLIIWFANIADIIFFVLSAFEFLLFLLVSPFGFVLYKSSNREDAINTIVNVYDSIFPNSSSPSLTTTVQQRVRHCTRNGK